VYHSVVHDEEICNLLRNAHTHKDQQEVGRKIKDRWAEEITASPSAVVGKMLSWAGRQDIRPTLKGSSPIGAILDERKQIQNNIRDH
jgi:hypothetical protein